MREGEREDTNTHTYTHTHTHGAKERFKCPKITMIVPTRSLPVDRHVILLKSRGQNKQV